MAFPIFCHQTKLVSGWVFSGFVDIAFLFRSSSAILYVICWSFMFEERIANDKFIVVSCSDEHAYLRICCSFPIRADKGGICVLILFLQWNLRRRTSFLGAVLLLTKHLHPQRNFPVPFIFSIFCSVCA